MNPSSKRRHLRASGVAGLGNVPANWSIERFDARTTTHRKCVDAKDLDSITVLHYSIPSLQEHGKAQVEEGGEIDSNKLLIECPQILVSKLNPHKQTIALAYPSDDYLTVASTEFVPLVPLKTSLSYVAYIWKSSFCHSYLLARCDSSTRSHQRVAPSDITRMQWAWPDEEEQSDIVGFLDREAARIDALIEKKTRFIELLREKRQALITSAVTMGLSPTAAMKVSGIEWMPRIPKHWAVKQLKHVVDPSSSITYGIVQAGPEHDGGIPYIKTSDMAGDTLPDDGYSRTSPSIEASFARSRVRPGDLVMSIRASIGKCLPVPNGLPLANLTQGTAKISPGLLIDKAFLLAFIQSDAAQTYFDTMAKGATFKEITLDALRRTPVLLPPMAEQVQISAHIAEATSVIDSLVARSARSIDLLKERRAALITAAVTGQIDVRSTQVDDSLMHPIGEPE